MREAWVILITLFLSFVAARGQLSCSVKERSSGERKYCQFPFIIGRKRWVSYFVVGSMMCLERIHATILHTTQTELGTMKHNCSYHSEVSSFSLIKLFSLQIDTTLAPTTKILMAGNGAPQERQTARCRFTFMSERRDFGAIARMTVSRWMWAPAMIMQIRASSVSLRKRGASLYFCDLQKSREWIESA